MTQRTMLSPSRTCVREDTTSLTSSSLLRGSSSEGFISIAMQASMTGHLVLSTLHTNDAPAAVSRLIDMGVEPFLITSSLTLVVGQRLARVPCSKCSEPVEADPRTLELLGLDPEGIDEAGLRKGPGCGFCAQTGYQGRVGLFEVVRVTRKMQELIVGRATEVAV